MAPSGLAVALLRGARALAGTDGRLVVSRLEAPNAPCFRLRVRELELPRAARGVRTTGCTSPAPRWAMPRAAGARGGAADRAGGVPTRPAARARSTAALDQGVARFGAETFTALAFAGGGEASWLCDSAAGATPVAACAPLPRRMARRADGHRAARARQGRVAVRRAAPHGDRLVPA